MIVGLTFIFFLLSFIFYLWFLSFYLFPLSFIFDSGFSLSFLFPKRNETKKAAQNDCPPALPKGNGYGKRVAFKRLPTNSPAGLKPKRKRFCTFPYAFRYSLRRFLPFWVACPQEGLDGFCRCGVLPRGRNEHGSSFFDKN